MHRVGTTLGGRYRVDELVAQGAAGIVYRAYRKDMERTVALKVLNSDDPNLLERFKREIKTTAKLHHPNIVSVFEAGRTDDGKIFYAMEFLAGETLRDLIEREGRLPAGRVLNVLQQLAAAVGAAHSMGIVHRNLNPDDLVIAQQAGNPDFCTILDFGVARLLESESELTMRGEILGQPEYLAPETLNDDEVAPPVDIYAIGCIAYECLVGQPPFKGRPRMVTVWMHATDPVPPFPQEVVASAPSELLQAVLWMLEKDPSKRPQDGLELAHRLDAIQCNNHDTGAEPGAFSLDGGPTVVMKRDATQHDAVAFGTPSELPPLAGFVEETPSSTTLRAAVEEPDPFAPTTHNAQGFGAVDEPPLFDDGHGEADLFEAFTRRSPEVANESETLSIPPVTSDEVPDFFKLPMTSSPEPVHHSPPAISTSASPEPVHHSPPAISTISAPAPAERAQHQADVSAPAPMLDGEHRDAERDRALASFATRAAAARPHSRRPVARGKLASGGKSCSFTVRAGDFDTLVGTALAGAARMSLDVGVQVVVQIPVDRQGSQHVHVGGVVTRAGGAPPELVIAVNEVDDGPLFETMVSRWMAR